MREILFRALTIHSREWVTGYYCKGQTKHWLLPEFGKIYIDIDPDTLGQFTGLVDKNGVKIFEGDILYRKLYLGVNGVSEETANVKWDDTESKFYADGTEYWQDWSIHGTIVIGTIHDHLLIQKESV